MIWGVFATMILIGLNCFGVLVFLVNSLADFIRNYCNSTRLLLEKCFALQLTKIIFKE